MAVLLRTTPITTANCHSGNSSRLHDDPERADRQRRFLVFDFDGNGKLEAKEYENLPARR